MFSASHSQCPLEPEHNSLWYDSSLHWVMIFIYQVAMHKRKSHQRTCHYQIEKFVWLPVKGRFPTGNLALLTAHSRPESQFKSHVDIARFHKVLWEFYGISLFPDIREFTAQNHHRYQPSKRKCADTILKSLVPPSEEILLRNPNTFTQHALSGTH